MSAPCGRRDVLIVSRSGDLHARLLLAEIRDLGGQADLVAADDLVDRGARWSTTGLGSISSAEGDEVRPEEYGALWWRRGATSQEASRDLDDSVHRALVDAAWRDFLIGVCASRFAGTWVSRPDVTAQAENKIVQLDAAHNAGLSVPITLITQDPAEVRRLWEATSGRLVVKALRNAGGFTYPTRRLTPEDLDRTGSIRLAPAIYQEEVPGVSHLRVHWLGTRFLTVRVRSNALDWRGDLGVPMGVASLPTETEDQLTTMLSHLGLAFGICDLKESPDGVLHFLEVNPQGQFAFWDALVPGANVCSAVAGYLLALARGDVVVPSASLESASA